MSDCLQHVLAIDPHNASAQQKYDDMLRRFPEMAELDPVKVAAAKAEEAKVAAVKVEAVKKKAEANHDSQLDLNELDDTPLFGDDKEPSDWKGAAD